jgi:enoyl-CoA hydratase
MMAGMTVRIERDGPLYTVILSRPQVRNAVDDATAQALFEAFERFDADESAAVAVLWGEGGTFCAGFDLKAITAGRAMHMAERGRGPIGPTRMRLGKPVIAAIAGYAVGGGMELALWCDLRVAAEDAVLGVFNRRWGVPLIDGGTVRLPRLIGASQAMDLVLTGRPVQMPEAVRMGLVNRVVPVGQERVAAEELAAQIARFPQTCLRHDRLSLLEQDGLTEDEALANEWRHGTVSYAADGEAGAARFASGAGRGGAFDAGT